MIFTQGSLRKKQNSGFVGLIIVLIVALALLKYVLGINIIDFLKSPDTIGVFSYIKRFIILIWQKVLVGPFIFIWNYVIVGIFWHILVSAFDLIKGFVDSQG